MEGEPKILSPNGVKPGDIGGSDEVSESPREDPRFKLQPKSLPPHGMEPYDLITLEDNLGALSEDQQLKLNQFKVKTRIENETYLRKHPEVSCLMTSFLGDILKERPKNVREFAATFFTDPKLPLTLQKTLEGRQQEIRTNRVLKRL